MEGSPTASVDDRGNDTIEIAENVTCRNAQRAKTALGHLGITSLIVARLAWSIVGRAIDLNRQPLAQAREIEAIHANWMLSPKLETARVKLQCLPKPHFSRVA